MSKAFKIALQLFIYVGLKSFVLDSQRLRNYLKTINSECVSADQKIMLAGCQTNRIDDALNRNIKTLKEKRSFTRIKRDEGESLTQHHEKIRTDRIHGTEGLRRKRKKW